MDGRGVSDYMDRVQIRSDRGTVLSRQVEQFPQSGGRVFLSLLPSQDS